MEKHHFLIEPFTLPFTLAFTLPFTDFSSFSCLVKVGSSGSTLSLTIVAGMSQRKIAPSLPTVTIFL